MSQVEVPQPNQSASRHLKEWIVGLVLFGLLTLALLIGGVYLAYGYIRESIQSASLTVPVFAGEPTENQIAFTGNDGNLWLVSPSGENLRQLTDDGRSYRFPTWSPDGTRIAFLGRGEESNVALYVSPTDRSAPSIVYEDDVASPFYLYWHPDSQLISFLTQEAADLSMRIMNVTRPEQAQVAGQGSPFYWAWSPLGDQLLMHVGGARATSDEAHISLLDNQLDAERVELEVAPGGFQSPAWSSNGDAIFYVGSGEANDAIYRTDLQTEEREQIVDLRGFAFMTVSPTDDHVAYVQMEPGTRPPFGRAYIVNSDGTNFLRLTNRPIASMYWSPDGSKLALLALDRGVDEPTARAGGLAAPLPQNFQLRWWIYDVAAEEIKPLVTFTPTSAFLQTIPFFDQYHQSLTFWSPDSRYFVVTKKVGETDAGSVWVYDTLVETSARKVGEGRLAVWSWR